jgi:hypothetical protein
MDDTGRMLAKLEKIDLEKLISDGPKKITALASKALPMSLEEVAECGDFTVLYASESVALDKLVLKPNSGVVVDGDLVVKDLLDARPLCEAPENLRFIVVTGDLKAGQMLIGCETYVKGTLAVEKTLIAESDGHAKLKVGKDLRARHIIALGHHVKVAGKTHAEFKIGFLGLKSDVQKSAMASAFLPTFVNKYGGIEINDVASAVLKGKNPFSQ